MNPNEVAFAKTMFKLKIYESNGKAFESLFNKIMGEACSEFRPVKPYGRKGDRKCDGFVKTRGQYFQVFSPEDPPNSQKDALKKLKSDFKGLKAYWEKIGKIQEFFFVFNDKYFGGYPDFYPILKKIEVSNKLNKADLFLAKNLEDILFDLPDSKIIAIVGHIPALELEDFQVISGITYFIGVWIAFEKACRVYAHRNFHQSNFFYPNKSFFSELSNKNIINKHEFIQIDYLREMRNRILHGEEFSVPSKNEIDFLLLISKKISQKVV